MSYRKKLILAITITGILVIFLSGVFLFFTIEDLLEERVLLRINTTGEIAGSEILENLSNRNPGEDIHTLLSVLEKQPRIYFASVLFRNRVVAYSSRPEWVGKPALFEDSGELHEERSGTYVKSFPLVDGREVRGFLQIGYSLQMLRRDMRDVSFTFAWISALSLLGIILSGWLIAGSLLKPLERMREAAFSIAHGDFSRKVPVRTNDVIGRLGEAFNTMGESLRDLTENLQEKVREATVHLQETNEQLRWKTEELAEANVRLRELDRLKSEFISFISHELKSPLAGIIGFAAMLRTQEDRPERRDVLAAMEAEGRRMASLVDDFLDISRIESGRMKYSMEQLSLESICREAVAAVPPSENRLISLDIQTALPEISGDRERLRQVVTNILGNAIKYSPDGGTVSLRLQRSDGGILLSISDQGPGVLPAEREKIFESYYRGSDELTRKLHGSGIGLAIVKSIVETHGGKLWVDPECTSGATFHVFLPERQQAGASA